MKINTWRMIKGTTTKISNAAANITMYNNDNSLSPKLTTKIHLFNVTVLYNICTHTDRFTQTDRQPTLYTFIFSEFPLDTHTNLELYILDIYTDSSLKNNHYAKNNLQKLLKVFSQNVTIYKIIFYKHIFWKLFIRCSVLFYFSFINCQCQSPLWVSFHNKIHCFFFLISLLTLCNCQFLWLIDCLLENESLTSCTWLQCYKRILIFLGLNMHFWVQVYGGILEHK